MQLLEDWWLEARMALHRLARVVCRDKQRRESLDLHESLCWLSCSASTSWIMSQYLKLLNLFPVQDILVLVLLQGRTSSGRRRTSVPVQGCPAPGTLTRGGKYRGELELFNSVNKDESYMILLGICLFNSVNKDESYMILLGICLYSSLSEHKNEFYHYSSCYQRALPRCLFQCQ